MAKNRNYSTVKGDFIRIKMESGLTNKQARTAWGRSEEAKQFKQNLSGTYIERPSMPPDGTHGDEWSDYAWSADDY